MTAMSKLWQEHALHWDDWENTPLRPCASEVFSFERIATGRTLLLGATQELRHITSEFADVNENGMDWLNLPFDDGTFDTIIGDGVTVVAGPSVIDAALKKVKPGGIVAFRVFLRKFVQTSLTDIDVHIDGTLSPEAQATAKESLGYPFNLNIIQGDFRPGKHEEFICMC